MKKKIGLHIKPLRQIDKRFEIYERILDANGLDHVRLCSSDNDFWDEVKQLDLFIYYWGQWDVERQIAQTIMPIIESELKITCFPNQKTCWCFDDKIKEYFLMKSHNFPIIQSWVFWEESEALEWAKGAPLPITRLPILTALLIIFSPFLIEFIVYALKSQETKTMHAYKH